ncbi:MAG: hypothetical protein AAF423_01295 [Pseudomonadota bacterium]
MEDFEDITGWQQELHEFKGTEEGWQYFDTSISIAGTTRRGFRRPQMLKFHQVIQVSELLLKHSELRSALQDYIDWVKFSDAIPEMSENHPKFAQSSSSVSDHTW